MSVRDGDRVINSACAQ